ncbi:recombinase RecT [Microbacterium sp. MPKO10]|uniref:recombinase RecT n=1 Tax=Microbacterium sp. MPKO10 TaxID=2989818 RepID=UPI002235A15E|nr:recombinase RecT [Microbacterium sp. MPKO10]MCW4458161.1 recombinase RecT [Microbacterium sp. MPKO10]
MTDLSQKIATKAVEQKKNPTIADHLKAYEPEFQRALGESMDAAKFAQDALTAIKATPALGQADARSLFGALFLAAQLKLPVGGPLAQFHLTPRKVGGQQVVVPIVGFSGYIQLAMNTGLYSKVSAFLVHENDYFTTGANSERGEFYDFKRATGDRGETSGVIAYAKVKGLDESQWVYVDAETMRTKHRPKYWEKTPWNDSEGEMFKKTGIRVLQKYLPKSAEAAPLAQAAAADQAVVKKLDNVPELQVEHDDDEPETIVAPEVKDKP